MVLTTTSAAILAVSAVGLTGFAAWALNLPLEEGNDKKKEK